MPLPMQPPAKSAELKTGAGITSRHDKAFLRGTLMFIEGEMGREMYIIRSGKIRILKQEGDRTVELAVLGKGSVLGELSLLDNQPRGATAQVVEEVSATVIDETILEATLAKIPSWLVSIIKTVVSRLRDTNRRNGDDIVKNNISGVISVLLMLLSKRLAMVENQNVVPLDILNGDIFSVTGVSTGETEKILTILILKEMVVIIADKSGREYVKVVNPSVLQMYLTYLRVKMRNGKMVGEDLSDKALEVGQFLLNASVASGKKQPDGSIQIGIPQVELQIQKEGKGRFVDPDALDELINSKAISKVAVASALAGSSAKGAVAFVEDKLRRVIMLRGLIATFNEEVVF